MDTSYATFTYNLAPFNKAFVDRVPLILPKPRIDHCDEEPVPYRPHYVSRSLPSVGDEKGIYWCISCMDEYRGQSPEELRMKHYQSDRAWERQTKPLLPPQPKFAFRGRKSRGSSSNESFSFSLPTLWTTGEQTSPGSTRSSLLPMESLSLNSLHDPVLSANLGAHHTETEWDAARLVLRQKKAAFLKAQEELREATNAERDTFQKYQEYRELEED